MSIARNYFQLVIITIIPNHVAYHSSLNDVQATSQTEILKDENIQAEEKDLRVLTLFSTFTNKVCPCNETNAFLG